MRICVLASGSSGNAAYLEANGRGLLLDAGVSCRRLKVLLGKVGRSLDDVSAVLLTHGHADHAGGLPGLLRERAVPVYAAPEVAEEVGSATAVEPGETVDLGEAEAVFFEVPHDSPTFGVRVGDGERTGAVATDLGEVGPETLRFLRGAEALVLEANHDAEWLWGGPYSKDLKRRVSSPRGHLSNLQAAEAALLLAPHGLKDLVLAHLSDTNNSPARATGTVRKVLRGAGYGGVRVRAALAKHPTPWIEVGRPIEEPAPQSAYEYGPPDTGDGTRLFGFEGGL